MYEYIVPSNQLLALTSRPDELARVPDNLISTMYVMADLTIPTAKEAATPFVGARGRNRGLKKSRLIGRDHAAQAHQTRRRAH